MMRNSSLSWRFVKVVERLFERQGGGIVAMMLDVEIAWLLGMTLKLRLK